MDYKNSNKPSIAFIESNTTGTGEKFIISAINNGFNIIFITTNPQKYKFLRELLIHPVIINTDDTEEIYTYLKTIDTLKAVISTSESFVYAASLVAKRLSLAAPNPESIVRCRNKLTLSNDLKEANLAVARTVLISSAKNVQANLSQFKLPVIVKPNIGTGSIGVKLCFSEQEVTDHVKTLAPNNSDILIQEYITGEEFSSEVIAFGSKYHFLGTTKKYLGEEPYFVETGHDFPALIDNELEKKIQLAVSRALESVGLDFGAAHIELKVFEGKIYIIEINPRLAGGMIPILIEHSQGIDLIGNLLKLYISQNTDFMPKKSLATKIEFLLPEREGVLKEISGFTKLLNQDGVAGAYSYKELGDDITIKGDFSDRLGFIIAKGKSISSCKKILVDALAKVNISIESKQDKDVNYSRGRLTSSLDPRVKAILTKSSFKHLDNLVLLSKINKAHITMLAKCNIISSEHKEIIYNAITFLEKEDFESIKQNASNPEIGYYLAYEKYLTNKIGIKIAGRIHTGRSRNDINATVQKLKSREVFDNLYSAIWNLRSTILRVADRHRDTQMPIYSQYQPAMPATYAYYLLAIEHSLSQYAHNLQQLLPVLNTSTLGACAGAGTTFPINPEITANLLGFEKVFTNALNVVATRDIELDFLANASRIGTLISRIAQDYQLWTTIEFGFVSLPDSLCGISSAMPQKKNPYLLEKIKGKAISISGKFFSAISVIQKTSFANSVEVGTEAFVNYIESFDELIRAIKLLELIIEGAKPLQANMSRSNNQGLTVSTILAEEIARNKNISFRESHDLVGKTISQAIKNNDAALEALLSLDDTSKDLILKGACLLEYGGGPGKESIANMIEKATNLLEKNSMILHTEKMRRDKINKL